MQSNQARSWQHEQQQQERVEQEKQIFIRKKKIGWITKGEKTLCAIVCVLVLCASYYTVSYASTTYSMNKEIQTLEQSVNQKVISNDGLLFEVKELSKPERIIQIAKENGFKTQNTKVKQATK